MSQPPGPHPDRHELAGALTALAQPAAAAAAPTATPPTGKRRGRPPKRSAELFEAPPSGEPDEPASESPAS